MKSTAAVLLPEQPLDSSCSLSCALWQLLLDTLLGIPLLGTLCHKITINKL